MPKSLPGETDQISGPETRRLGRRHLPILLLVILAYFAANKLALFFPDTERVLAAIWPAAGIGLAALLLTPRFLWPAILAAIFLAGNAANLLSGRPLLNSLGFMTANVLESYACAWLITRWCGEGLRFNRVKEVGALLTAAVFLNAVTACLGAWVASSTSPTAFSDFWTTWWIADGLGLFMVTPFLITWAHGKIAQPHISWAQRLESVVFIALFSLCSWLSFQPSTTHTFQTPQPYLLMALLCWPASRLGLRTTTLSVLVLSFIALTSQATITGPLLWGGEDEHDRLLRVELFLFLAAVTTYLLATAMTERASAARALRDRQAMLARTEAIAHIGSWEWDPTTDTVTWSEELFRIFQLDPAKVAPAFGQQQQLYTPESLERVTRAAEETLRTGTPFELEIEIVRQDGERRHCLGRGYAENTALAAVTRLHGSLQDITEQKQAKQQLQASEESYRTIVETAGEGIWTLDHDAVTTYVNAIMAEMVGYTVEEMVGKPAVNFLFPEDLPDFLKQWGTRRLGQPSRYERRLRKKDGNEAWFLASTTPLPGANGMLLGSLGMFTDITERRRAEELRDQIERTIQHDLRTPASSSIYLARMLHDIIGMTEEDHNLIDHFEQAGRDMLDTLNASLDLYKIETKQFDFQPETVDCLAVLQGLITSTTRQPQFASTPITLLLNGQAPGQDAHCSCLGNTNLLRMSLQNLLINALEASAQGAPVVLVLDSGTGCTMTIRNTGVVPPEIRERFFDKYVTLGKHGGTGIGTYTAKMLVLAQGGEVTMNTSDERNETEVTLWLPS